MHRDKDHQTPFVGGPDTLTTNPRWRTAVILKEGKLIDRISATVLPIADKFGTVTVTHIGPLHPIESTVKNSNF